ncbi:MAG: multicopper oxidase domain-containing protein [Terriglobales bacterium]
MRTLVGTRWISVVWGIVLSFGVPAFCAAQTTAAPSGKTHTYYVAADEVEWDYAPSGINKMTGKPFQGYATVFVEHGPHRIGKVYRKAIYREYTDESFTTLKPRPAEWEHAGIQGPVLRGEVGDTIRVVFKNNATHAYSMHPHGVFYNKDSEGSNYDDGTSGSDKEDDDVPPGHSHVYIWQIPERAGPGPGDPSSIVWLYHSHESKDVESGLIGPIIVTARGIAGPDGRPKDVDREFVTLFMMFDENTSWYIDHNIQTYTTDPKGVNKLDFVPADLEGNLSGAGTGFAAANIKVTINGYIFANMPVMTMKKGERVRWYLASLGEFPSLHTPHWHGNVVLNHGRRTDVVPLLQAQMETVDMVPDDPGTWLFHCHIEEHMDAGMVALYKVEP